MPPGIVGSSTQLSERVCGQGLVGNAAQVVVAQANGGFRPILDVGNVSYELAMSANLEREIASIIANLKAPLRPDERAAGWTRAVKSGYVQVFADLLTQVRATGAIPYFGVVRSLDAYGIGGGELYDRMIRVANEANDQLR